MISCGLLGRELDSLNWGRKSSRMALRGWWARPQAHPFFAVFDIRPDTNYRSRVVSLVDRDLAGDNVFLELDDYKVLHGYFGQVLTHNLYRRAR